MRPMVWAPSSFPSLLVFLSLPLLVVQEACHANETLGLAEENGAHWPRVLVQSPNQQFGK